MGTRKKGDKSLRKGTVRQVCMTFVQAQMLEDVARKHYDGRVSHAILDLIDDPLAALWAELDENDTNELYRSKG